jgi:hypothetical protein
MKSHSVVIAMKVEALNFSYPSAPGSLAIAEASLRRFLKTAAQGGLCLPTRGRDKRPRLRDEV